MKTYKFGSRFRLRISESEIEDYILVRPTADFAVLCSLKTGFRFTNPFSIGTSTNEVDESILKNCMGSFIQFFTLLLKK